MLNEFEDRTFPETSISGNDALASQDIDLHSLGFQWGLLLTICTTYYLVSAACLHVLLYPPTDAAGARREKVESDVLDVNLLGGEANADGLQHETAPIIIRVENISLAVKRSNRTCTMLDVLQVRKRAGYTSVQQSEALTTEHSFPLLAEDSDGAEAASMYVDSGSPLTSEDPSSSYKLLLQNVSATMRPGRLCALMGGSGSGKTTLLNLIAGRLPFAGASTLIQALGLSKLSYTLTGCVTLNNQVPSRSEMTQHVAYLLQDDFHLPSLTVRETLVFSAMLSLPQHMSRESKLARVHSVLNQLGLASCADALVGSSDVKGASGGEKRRLSIGLKLLKYPSALLLDEPTSGMHVEPCVGALTIDSTPHRA
jgi:ABC-type cobalamin/Fe3+-siderophores transport system ATPase subunit